LQRRRLPQPHCLRSQQMKMLVPPLFASAQQGLQDAKREE
jgi:hypothetical protein